MKKVLALLMTLVLALSLSACKNPSENLSSNGSVPSSLTTETTDFEAPQDYAVVLLASINPQVRFYLDRDGVVLALEAANEDAEQIINDIAFENADYQTVIKRFITAANAKGYINNDSRIDFEISKCNDSEIDTEEILNKASLAAKNTANELNITLDVKIISDEPQQNESETQNDTPQNEPTQSQSDSAHTHTFLNATCTEAAKCSCGETNGSPLGHDWKAADCKTPKACKTCGATEGEKGDHSYSAGKCTVCGKTNILNPKNDLKNYIEYIGNLQVSGDMLIGAALQFEDEACVVTDRYFNSIQSDPNQEPITFNGKNYYSEGGGQNPHYFELTDTEIIIKGSFWEGDPDAVTIKLTLQADGMLKVTYSTNSLFPVGTILSTNIKDVLK